MIVRYLDIHAAVYAVLSELKLTDMLRNHSRIDIDLLERFTLVLKPFKDVTVLMSTQVNVSSSLVKPLLNQLMKHAKPKDSEPPVLHQAKATLFHDLQARYKLNDTEFLDVVSFCDPRVKSLMYLDEHKRHMVKEKIIAAIEVYHLWC